MCGIEFPDIKVAPVQCTGKKGSLVSSWVTVSSADIPTYPEKNPLICNSQSNSIVLIQQPRTRWKFVFSICAKKFETCLNENKWQLSLYVLPYKSTPISGQVYFLGLNLENRPTWGSLTTLIRQELNKIYEQCLETDLSLIRKQNKFFKNHYLSNDLDLVKRHRFRKHFQLSVNPTSFQSKAFRLIVYHNKTLHSTKIWRTSIATKQ